MVRQILLLLLFTLCAASTAIAQNDRLGANLFGITVTPVSGDTYRVEGNYNDPSGVTTGNDLEKEDWLWTPALSAGDTCRVMVIDSIIQSFAGYVVFWVDANGQGAPSTQNSKLMRPTTENGLAYVPNDGNEALLECISQYFAYQLDEGTGGSDGNGIISALPAGDVSIAAAGNDLSISGMGSFFAGVTGAFIQLATNAATVTATTITANGSLVLPTYSAPSGDTILLGTNSAGQVLEIAVPTAKNGIFDANNSGDTVRITSALLKQSLTISGVEDDVDVSVSGIRNYQVEAEENLGIRTDGDMEIAAGGYLDIDSDSINVRARVAKIESVNLKGLEYASDYSATFTNRSLVDKAYVDANAGGSTDAADINIADAGSLYISTNVEGALQESGANIAALDLVLDALRQLSGMPVSSTHFGTFTGTTIPDNSTTKAALQALETAVEAGGGGAAVAPTIQPPDAMFSLNVPILADTYEPASSFSLQAHSGAVGGTVYYVSTTGNDANTGADWANALRSIDVALAKAETNKTIYVAKGYYTKQYSWDNYVPANGSTLAVIGDFSQGTGDSIYITKDIRDQLGTWNAVSNHYEASLTTAPTHVVGGTLGTYGTKRFLVQAANAAEVESTPGRWFWISNVLHFRDWDSSAPNNAVIEVVDRLVPSVRLQSPGTVYLKNLNLRHGGVHWVANATTGQRKLYVENCTIFGGGNTVHGVQEAVFLNCIAYNSPGDDLFNYDISQGIPTQAAEIGVLAFNTAEAGTTVTNAQASTAHGLNTKVVRVGGTYKYTRGDNVADVTGSRTWMLGCTFSTSLVSGLGNYNIGTGANPAFAWIDDCVSDGVIGYAYKASNSATIYRLNSPGTTTTDGTGAISAYTRTISDSTLIASVIGVDRLMYDDNFTNVTDRDIPTAAAVKAYVDANAGGGGGDDLGDHTATTTLNMNSNAITGATNITATGTATLGGNAYPTTTGTSGQAMVTNGAGTLSFATVGLPSGTSGQTLRHDGTNFVATNFLYNSGTAMGLGTTSPQEFFHLYNASSNTVMRFEVGVNGAEASIAFRNHTAQTWKIGQVNNLLSGSLIFGTSNAIGSSSNARLVISRTGNVGVGTGTTTEPTSKLQVEGDLRVATLTATPTRLIGADANGIFGAVALGTTNRLAMWSASGLVDAPLLSSTLLEQTQVTAFGLARGTTGEAPLATTAGRIRWNTTEGHATISDGTAHRQLPYIITASATLDFPSTSANSTSDLTITLTGAVLGDNVIVGAPYGSCPAGVTYFGVVSAADTVTVRLRTDNGGSIDPVSGTFKVTIIR